MSPVSIAPMLNLNRKELESVGEIPQRFNRTNVEFKRNCSMCYIPLDFSFNRTNVEFKPLCLEAIDDRTSITSIAPMLNLNDEIRLKKEGRKKQKQTLKQGNKKPVLSKNDKTGKKEKKHNTQKIIAEN